MSGVSRGQPFFQHGSQRLVQTEIHVNGSCVMICTRLATPVIPDHRHVEVPAGHLGLASIHRLNGSTAERDRRQSRGTAQTFLGSRIRGIDIPAVNLDRHTSQ